MICERTDDARQIEADTRCSAIEELIEEAEDEFDLLVAMNEVVKPWEADPESVELAKLYSPEFRETPEQHVKNWKPSDEESLFKEFDAIIGLTRPEATSTDSTPKAETS